MSFAALAWASKQNVGKASDKLILLAYADRHNEETGCAYPSIDWLCEFSSLNRKTVIASVARLEAFGAVSDTGERMGATKQIKVYRLHVGTVPKTERYQKRNGTRNGAKQYRKRDTEPIKEPIPSEAKASSGRAKHELPDDWEPKEFGIDTESRKIVDGWPPGELSRQLERFRAHHLKLGNRFKNWQAAWSTWALNSPKFGAGNGRTDPVGRHQSGLSATTRAAASVFGPCDGPRVSGRADSLPRLGGPGGDG